MNLKSWWAYIKNLHIITFICTKTNKADEFREQLLADDLSLLQEAIH